MSAILILLTLATTGLAVIVVVIGYEARLRSLARRVEALERRPAPSPKALASPNPLQGVRVALSIQQDHPHPVLATLLKEALLREEASPLSSGGEGTGGEGLISVQGNIVCNGYADVYFRADLEVGTEGQTLFVLSEKPPHGDRQENLAREVVARLKAEMAKRERQSALRELG